jgi:hypothetical protein
MVGLVETKRRAKPFILASIYLPGEDEGDNIIPDNLRQAIDQCKHSNLEFVGGGYFNAHSF